MYILRKIILLTCLFLKKLKSIFLSFYYGFNKKTSFGKHVRIVNSQYIEMGENVILDDGCELCVLQTISQIVPHLKIGNNVLIGKGCRIGCDNHIFIGNNVMFAPNVHISDRNHSYENIDIPINKQPISTHGAVVVKDDTWLGFGCQIMSGVTVGKHCVIAAGAIVVKDVPDYCVVGGNPARILKKYNVVTKEWKNVINN